MRSALLIAVAALVAVPAAGAAAPPGFYESLVLEPAASFVAGRPARVYCALTPAGWQDYAAARRVPDAYALTVVGTDQTMLEPVTCRVLRTQLRSRRVDEYAVAAAVRTLVHEAIHQRGVADEGQTECAAMHEMPRVAVKFFHVKPGKQLRALMASAWYSHRATPATYQTLC